MPLLHGRKKSFQEPRAQCQQWNQSLRWFVYHWHVGIWRVCVSLGWIDPGGCLIPPTMNLGGLHHFRGKEIHKHRIIDIYRLYMYHNHRRNTWYSWLGVVFCTDDEACHILNKWLLLPQVSSFPCNQLLNGFIWILPLVTIYISGRIQSFEYWIIYLLGCQRRKLAFILLLRDNIDLPTLRTKGSCQCRSELCCRNWLSKRWHEGMFR